jgi:homopolymeric O-antigen transport system permease protein
MTDVPVTIIRARPQTVASRLAALWQYRGFYRLLLREITFKKVRGTLLGFWWLIIRPLVPAVVAVTTFTFVVRIETNDVPYVIFFFSGFITWQIFQATLIFVPRTLSWMQGLMRRTYFPKILVPLASIGPPLIELLIVLALFAVAVVFVFFTKGSTHLQWGWMTLWFPACLILALMFGLAVGMVLSVIALFFRDIIFTVSYFAQLMLFLTPILYPVKFVPEQWRWIVYVFNPMAQLVEVSRWSLTGYGDFHPFFLSLAIGTILLTFVLSVAFFLRAETYLADEM